MPRLLRPFTPDEYRILSEAGIPGSAVSKYSNGHIVPHTPRRLKIIGLLGRDPWNGAEANGAGRPKTRQPAPVAAPGIVNQTETNCQTKVNYCQIDVLPRRAPVAVAVYEVTLNACADDGLCLAARNATMRYTPNTLMDQRRVNPCVNCKQGIARAKAEAAKKTVHLGEIICPSCGEEKSRDARTCHACASERKRALA